MAEYFEQLKTIRHFSAQINYSVTACQEEKFI